MSYDLEIATREQPSLEQIEAWAAGRRVKAVSHSGQVVVSKSSWLRGEQFLFSLEEPEPAEPEDFHPQLTEVSEELRWTTPVNVPYSAPRPAMDLGLALAEHLAEINGGAVFDPQLDAVVWPDVATGPLPAPGPEGTLSVIKLHWFVAPARWGRAPETLVRVLADRLPEALPVRYGPVEPMKHRFDPEDPRGFVDCLVDEEDGNGYWSSKRPSLGGSWTAPIADRFVPPDEERLRIGTLELVLDGRAVDEDPDLRETVVDLFAEVASELGAFFAAAQVEPEWVVTTGYRLVSTPDTMMNQGEHFRRGMRWQGLPPVPMWLSWFGGPYRDLVAPHLEDGDRRDDGILLRLGVEPRPVGELSAWPVPKELTYRYRPSHVESRDGTIHSNHAQLEDEAPTIPPLD
jgi:hypothetical protein